MGSLSLSIARASLLVVNKKFKNKEFPG